MNIGLIFVHGWGFDSYFWNNLKSYFNAYPYIYHGNNYFNICRTLEVHDIPQHITVLKGKKWIPICHSYGLARFIRCLAEHPQLQEYIAGIVALAGFLVFTKNEKNPYGTDALILNKMIKKFEQSPVEVLQDFHSRCSFDNSYYQKNIKILNPMLKRDLIDLLHVDVEDPFLKVAKPTLYLTSEDDQIVSQDVGKSIQTTHPFAKLISRKDGGHALGFNKAKWCATEIHHFIEWLKVLS